MNALYLVAIFATAWCACGFEPNTGSQLLIPAGSCSAFEFTTQPAFKFSYTLKLVSVAAAACNRGQIRLTKFYIKEACLKQRDNELGLNSYNTLTCSAATDSAPGTCSAAFNNADGSSLLTAGNVTDAQTFDSGNVCATYGDRGFVYVQNNCATPITVGMELDTTDYQGKICVQVAGKSISGVGIALITVGVLLALIVLSFLCCCCCRCFC